jgi:RNA polymerase sigma factor (sigma-70 family)
MTPITDTQARAVTSIEPALDRGAVDGRHRMVPGTRAGGRYLAELSRRPCLPPRHERRLLAAAQEGDAQARAELVDGFMPLIASVARQYRGLPGVDRQELLQEGVVGLLRAIERYDASRGTPFWGYAVWWVRHAMQQLVSELARPVVLSDRAQRQLARIKDARRELHSECGREASRAELAARAGVEADQVGRLLAVDYAPRSTEEAITAEDGVVGSVGELLVDPLADGEYERVLTAIEVQELHTLLAELSDRERMIVRARYGLDGEEQSLRQLADRLGVSAERVRQIEQRALGKLAAAGNLDDPKPGAWDEAA